jgi:hypothetical protein
VPEKHCALRHFHQFLVILGLGEGQVEAENGKLGTAGRSRLKSCKFAWREVLKRSKQRVAERALKRAR